MKLLSSYKLNAGEQQVELEGKPVRVADAGSYIEKSGALWCVRSTNPQDKNFGCYASKQEAQSHLRNLEAVSQYGQTGWQYGQRTVGRSTGYIPQRTLSGFPAARRGGMAPKHSIGRAAPVRRGVGRGTAFGMKPSHANKIVRSPNLGHAPKISMPSVSPMGRSPKTSPLGRSGILQSFADMGEPMAGNMSHAHIDPVTWFRPPSLTQREKPGEDNRVPADNPGEKNDKYLDVTKRNSKDTMEQRMKLLKRSAPGGLPPSIPARTTAIEPHQAYYAPLSQMLSSAKPRKTKKLLKGASFTSYARRGCI